MRRLLGGILVAFGILIACTSGLCSLTVLTIGLTGGSPRETLTALPLVLGLIAIFGGIPFLAGIGLVKLGRSMIRRAREEEDGDRYG